MSSVNGESDQQAPLELGETVEIHSSDDTALTFEVVGLLEDPDLSVSYAVLWHEGAADEEGQFIVTDMQGKLLEDDAAAQEVLDDFLAFAEEEEDDSATSEEPR